MVKAGVVSVGVQRLLNRALVTVGEYVHLGWHRAATEKAPFVPRNIAIRRPFASLSYPL